MSLNVAPNRQFTELEIVQWEKWKQGAYDGLTDEEIGKQIHRSRQTITRLKRKAKLNGEYTKWADEAVGRFHEEYWELHKKVKVTNPELAYVESGKRVDKTLKQRIEAHGETTVTKTFTLNWNILSDDDRELLTNAARVYFRAKRDRSGKEQPISIH